MSELALLLEEYLATRRALGNRLELPARLLKRFVAFAVQHQPPSSPPNAHCNGPPSRAMHSRPSGRAV